MENEEREISQELPMDADPQNNNGQSIQISNETENAILRLLKKIFNWKVLTAIATILGALGAVATVWAVFYKDKESENDRLKREINEKAQIIEATFHPNEIIIDSLSTPDKQLVKDFQTSSLRMVTYWKSIYSMQPISEYETTDLGMVLSAVNSQLSTINNFDIESQNNLTKTMAILKYGQQNNIPQYTPLADKIMIIYEKAGKRDAICSNTQETVLNDLMKIYTEASTNPDKLNSDRIVKAVKPIEELYNSKSVLEYINSFFSCVVELNSYYMDYLNNSTIAKVDITATDGEIRTHS